jgi:hypothetical protein
LSASAIAGDVGATHSIGFKITAHLVRGFLSDALGVQQNCNHHATDKSHRLLTTPWQASHSQSDLDAQGSHHAWLQECGRDSFGARPVCRFPDQKVESLGWSEHRTRA